MRLQALFRKFDAGYTLIEMTVVGAIVIVGSVVTIPVTMRMVQNAKGDSALEMTSTFLQSARNRAVAERRNFLVTFVSDTSIQVDRIEVPDGTLTFVDQLTLEGDNEFVKTPGLPDTPDNFAGADADQFHRHRARHVHQRRLAHRCSGRRHQRHDLHGQARYTGDRARGHDLGRHGPGTPVEMERLRMGAVNRVPPAGPARDERGFSLIEVLAAMVILMVGLLPLAALFATAVQRMAASTPMMVAREKAREAIESVHAARDTGEASWTTIRNTSETGGVFLEGAKAIKDPGTDGLVNTADDGADEMPIELFTREIDINPINYDDTSTVNPNLREVRVIVNYRVGNNWQTYTLVTYISSYS